MSVYKCEICNFFSMNKSDYNKHITTMKHLSRIQEICDEAMSARNSIEDRSVYEQSSETERDDAENVV